MLRPLERRDFSDLARWLDAPHVRASWRDQDASLAHLESKYGPRIDGASPVAVFVVAVDGAGVGIIQTCPASAYGYWPSELGLDEAIIIDGLFGAAEALGRGHATAALQVLARSLLRPGGEQSVIAACTARANHRTRRLLERAGFCLVFEGDLVRDGFQAQCVYTLRGVQPDDGFRNPDETADRSDERTVQESSP
ncbi:MAG TPA: GNAT family N-acetyltransferase [Acidimicrobiales bacterium]|nr:GNAT family N-acetyltransferase [Acidimicrobiales bacterium]